MAPLGLGLARAYDPLWLTASFWLHPYADEGRSATADIAFLKERPGPALCETLAFCYWAGKPEAVDVFNTGEAYLTHARHDDALVALIGSQHFAAIEFDGLEPFPLGPGVGAVLSARYRVDHENDDGVFLVPRR
jgi:hypothetical protein